MPVRRTCSAWYWAIHDLPPRGRLAKLVEHRRGSRRGSVRLPSGRAAGRRPARPRSSPRTSGQSSRRLSRSFRSLRTAGRDPGLELGEERERLAQGHQVAGQWRGPVPTREASRSRSWTCGQGVAKVGPQAAVAHEFGDGHVAIADRVGHGQGRGQPLVEQAGTHRRAGAVDGLQERAGSRPLRGGSSSIPGCGASSRRAPSIGRDGTGPAA